MSSARDDVRAFTVTVSGFGPMTYSARSAAHARSRCFRDYQSYDDSVTFKDFLRLSVVRRDPTRDADHKRILVCGKPATRIISNRGHSIEFMYDGRRDVCVAHPLEVAPAP